MKDQNDIQAFIENQLVSDKPLHPNDVNYLKHLAKRFKVHDILDVIPENLIREYIKRKDNQADNQHEKFLQEKNDINHNWGGILHSEGYKATESKVSES
jgi:hypothetical protein